MNIGLMDGYASFGVRRGRWGELFCEENLSALKERMFLLVTGPNESKKTLQ